MYFYIMKIVYTFFALLHYSAMCENISTLKRASSCCATATIQNCFPEKKTYGILKWYIRNDIKIASNVQKGCAKSLIQYKWELSSVTGNVLKDPKGTTDAVLYVLKYSLTPGRYSISLQVTESQDDIFCDSNWFNVIPEHPNVRIKGGTSRTVPDNQIIYFVAAVEDYNSENVNVKSFTYVWSCKISGQSSCSIRTHDSDDTAYIPTKHAVDGAQVTVTLNVTNSFGKKSFASQHVVVRSQSLPMKIFCLKNCLTYVNTLDVAVFYGYCGKSCNRSSEFKWSMIDDNTKGPVTDVVVHRITYLSTNFGTLEPNKNYTVRLSIGEVSYAEYQIETDNVELGECDVESNEEDELFTLFRIDCRSFTSGVLYHLYQVYELYEDEQWVLLAVEGTPYFEVYLGNGRIYLQIYRISGFYSTMTLDISGAETTAINKIEVLSHLRQYVPSMVRCNSQERAVQLINSLVDNVNNDPAEIKQIGFYVVEIMKLLPVYTLYDSYQIGSILGKFVLPQEDADPVYQKYLSSFCKIVSSTFMQHIIKQTYRKELFSTAEQFMNYMDACANYALNDKNVEIENDGMPQQQLLNNDYPNYDELEHVYTKSEFRSCTQQAMELIRITAAGLALTLNIDQVRFSHETDVYSVTCVLFPEINKQTFDHETTKVYLGYDRRYKDTVAAVTHIVYKNNLFWWHKQSKQIATSITDINIHLAKTGRLVTNVGNNLTIVFKVANKEINEIDGSVTLPRNKRKWTPKIINSQMAVHRFNALHGKNLILILDTPIDAEMVVTINHRPELHDFKKSINLNKPATLIYKNYGGDSWFYVAILPQIKNEESASGNVTLDYRFKYALQSCNYWNYEKNEWSSKGCETVRAANLKEIHCKSNHMSTFMSSIGSTKTKKDTLLIIPFRLKMKYTYVIPIITAIFFILYFSFILIGASKIKSFNLKDKLLFLADNLREERYGYLLIVKTGNNKNSGTTSNISVQLIGRKSISREHVLNYPDPEKRILQRHSEDWFVLTTKEHLEDLIEIYIWLDSVGTRPSWCCEYIRVYDLQMHVERMFYVNAELNVLDEQKSYIRVTASAPLKSDLWKDKLRTKFSNYKAHVHSWKIFHKTDDFASYMRRVTIIFSMIYTVFTICLFIIAAPSLTMKDSIDYAHFSVSAMIIAAFVSSAISFAIHLGIQLLFQKFSHEKEIEKRKRNIRLTWILLVFLLVTNLSILAIFSFWVPYNAVIIWITSVCLSLIFIILIYENILLLLKSFLLKSPKEEAIFNANAIIEEAETQRLYLHQKFGDAILRPYLISKYKPLTKEKLKYKAAKEKTRYEFSNLLNELITFATYVILLLIVIILSGSSELRRNNEAIKRIIIKSNDKDNSFEISKYQDIYDYLNETLIPRCFPEEWYEGADINNMGLLSDAVNHLIGIIQIRQKRVIQNECEKSKSIYSVNMSCVPEYDEYYAGSFPDKPYAGKFKYIWKERKVNIYTVIAVTYGKINWYSGSGFIVFLGRNKYNSMYVLKYMKDNRWIDQQTRLVLIKFWTYNVNQNVFSTVNIIIEKSATGLFLSSHSIYTIKLYSNTLYGRVGELIIAVLFVLATLKLALMWFAKLLKTGKRMLLNFWNCFDLIIIVFTVTFLVLHVQRSRSMKKLMNTVELSPNNAFISFSTITYVSRAINVISAILTCLALIRLWKYLRFSVVFRVVENTIKNAKNPLLIAFAYHMVILMAFMFIAHIFFGTRYHDFVSLTSTFITLILLSFNLFDEVNVVFVDPLSRTFYAIFTVCLLSIYTFYISIIVFHYSKCCQELSNFNEPYTIKDYLREEFNYYKELLRIRLRAGQQSQPVYPKSVHHRYADCLIMPSSDLQFMALIARGVIRNLRNSSDMLNRKEIILMLDIIKHLIKKTSITRQEIFFESAVDNEIKLIQDARIAKMAAIVNKMYESKRKPDSHGLIIEADSNLDRLQYYEQVLELIGEVFNNISFQ